jgi:hypothetical protein
MAIHSIDLVGSSNEAETSVKDPKTIESLPGRCAYFPHTDYFNLAILRKNYDDPQLLQEKITERLLHYLLCFDKILIHSSDPLRSEIVFDILKSNDSLILDGSINFVFSSSITDIHRDYEGYIKRKKKEYTPNQYSKLDTESLEQPHITTDYYAQVINLLNKSPYLIRRSESGEKLFCKLINEDLTKAELITIGSDYLDTSEINLLNLTLEQLLHMKIHEKGSIYDNDEIDSFINSWEKTVSNEAPFSRHTITTQLNEMVNKSNRKSITRQVRIRLVNAIEYRLSMLYSKTYCADHFLLDFDFKKEMRGLYSWHFIQLFLSHIAGQPVQLNNNKIQEIRSNSEWREFKEVFALSMCDLHTRVAFAPPLELKRLIPPDNTYKLVITKFNLNERFPRLKRILKEER